MAVSEMEQGAFAWASGTSAPGVGASAPVRSGPGVREGGQGAGARAPARKKGARIEARAGSPGAGELPPDNELWDVRAAARFLKRSVSWVYHRAEDGTLPVKRLAGWGVRFVPSELRAWVGAATRPARR